MANQTQLGLIPETSTLMTIQAKELRQSKAYHNNTQVGDLDESIQMEPVSIRVEPNEDQIWMSNDWKIAFCTARISEKLIRQDSETNFPTRKQ